MYDNYYFFIHLFIFNLLFVREPLPEPWNSELDSFQKLLVLKCLRADKVTNAMQVSPTHFPVYQSGPSFY